MKSYSGLGNPYSHQPGYLHMYLPRLVWRTGSGSGIGCSGAWSMWQKHVFLPTFVSISTAAHSCRVRFVGELHWHLRKQAQTSLATPFSACLEVSEMVLWEGLKRDINTESEMSGGSGIPRLVPRFARGERRPTLCDVISDGAVGLEAFVGRKGRCVCWFVPACISCGVSAKHVGFLRVYEWATQSCVGNDSTASLGHAHTVMTFLLSKINGY